MAVAAGAALPEPDLGSRAARVRPMFWKKSPRVSLVHWREPERAKTLSLCPGSLIDPEGLHTLDFSFETVYHTRVMRTKKTSNHQTLV